MKLLIVLAFCVVATVAVPFFGQSKPLTLKDLYANVRPSNDLDSRIIGGSPAVIGQFPWQVAVFFVVSGSTYFCGGSVISSKWVLTAAHCAQGASQFTLHFGGITLYDFEVGRITVHTNTAIIHPAYNPDNLNNDIALIKLNDPICCNDRIKPIKLPPIDSVTEAGIPVTVSGWGATSSGSPYISSILNYVALTTISNAQCAAIYVPGLVIDSTICAVGNPHHSTCNGDSGGPLVVYDEQGEATQVGIVSFVASAGCDLGYPSGYVRTESFLGWIATTIGPEPDSCTCS